MKTILIIEDDSALLASLRSKFTKEGYNVLSAVDGADGLNQALSQKPDLIILDILMARMTGLEMLEKLREDAWGRAVHVIVLTNLIEEKFKASIERHNVDAYFIKSDVKLEEISNKVKSILSK